MSLKVHFSLISQNDTEKKPKSCKIQFNFIYLQCIQLNLLQPTCTHTCRHTHLQDCLDTQMSRPSQFKNHHFVSKPVPKWILIEVTNAINLLASIPNLHSPCGAMLELMGQRTVTSPLNDSWDRTKIKINRKTMYKTTHPCAVIVEDNC